MHQKLLGEVLGNGRQCVNCNYYADENKYAWSTNATMVDLKKENSWRTLRMSKTMDVPSRQAGELTNHWSLFRISSFYRGEAVNVTRNAVDN